MCKELKIKYVPKYFTNEEFKRASPACSLSDMSPAFMIELEKAREMADVPFVVASAFRSVEHELKRGRPGTSSHCKGCAIDLRCSDSSTRLKIINALLSVGFRRIGINKAFIHVDADYTKPQCVWLYD